jgi:hypothetical protein
MLSKFYKCHLYIYIDINYLVQKIKYYIINNVFFIVEKFNKYACKTTKAVK